MQDAPPGGEALVMTFTAARVIMKALDKFVVMMFAQSCSDVMWIGCGGAGRRRSERLSRGSGWAHIL